MSSNRPYREWSFQAVSARLIAKKMPANKVLLRGGQNQTVNIFLPTRDPAILDGLDLTEEERSVLIDNINRRLTPQAVKIRAGNTFILTVA